MRYDLIFISAALLCLLTGEGIGLWMGMTQDFTLSPAHAHLNLLGWVTLALYGLTHRAYPGLGGKWLALVQCIIAIAGSVLLPLGIGVALFTQDVSVAKSGSVSVIAGTLLFIVMFAMRAMRKDGSV